MINRKTFLFVLSFGVGLATALPTSAQAVDCTVNPDSTCLGPQFLHPNYTPVAKAADATHASAADEATSSAHAALADQATAATTATNALHANAADDATLAQQAVQANQASVALQADVANLANQATTATHATTADQATTATTTMYAWASGNTTVFPDPTSANNYAQAQADAQNAVYLQAVGCGSIGGACPPTISDINQWSGNAEWDTYTGSIQGASGAPCLSIFQEVHSSLSGATCTMFIAAVITPPTTTVVQGVTYYVPHFNPGFFNSCANNPTVSTCQTANNGGNGGGDGSGPGGGDGGGGTGGGSGGGNGD